MSSSARPRSPSGPFNTRVVATSGADDPTGPLVDVPSTQQSLPIAGARDADHHSSARAPGRAARSISTEAGPGRWNVTSANGPVPTSPSNSVNARATVVFGSPSQARSKAYRRPPIHRHPVYVRSGVGPPPFRSEPSEVSRTWISACWVSDTVEGETASCGEPHAESVSRAIHEASCVRQVIRDRRSFADLGSPKPQIILESIGELRFYLGGIASTPPGSVSGWQQIRRRDRSSERGARAGISSRPWRRGLSRSVDGRRHPVCPIAS